MSDAATKIRELIKSNSLEQAYNVGCAALSAHPNDKLTIKAMYELSAKLRSECMGLAARKMDSGAPYFSTEALLRKVNEQTGEDMYGNFI